MSHRATANAFVPTLDCNSSDPHIVRSICASARPMGLRVRPLFLAALLLMPVLTWAQSLSPTSGPISGGTVVTISGNNFQSGSTVTFGGRNGWVFSLSTTSIRVLTPAHAAGTVSVVVTSRNGRQATLANSFTYKNPAPAISSISPATGLTTGGTPLTLSGNNFVSGAKVTIGGSAATVASVSATSIRITTPVHTAGAASVVVSNPDLQSATLGNGFTYVASVAITTTALPDGTPGTQYSAALTASGGTAPYAWSLVSGQLPSGLALGANGVISGTPTSGGQFSFQAQVTDSSPLKQTRSQSLAIAVIPPVQITTANIPNGQINSPYNVSVSATGGTSPYVWAVTSGALPAGVVLSGSNGTLSGTPTAAGNFNVTLGVQDAKGVSTTSNFSFTVVAALVITTAALPKATEGTDYAATLSAVGGTPGYTWSIPSGQLPPGLTMAATTGVISGTPNATGTFSFTAAVTDNGNPAQTKTQTAVASVAAPAPQTGTGIGSPLLTGMTASHHTIPSGWNLIDVNGFTGANGGLTSVEQTYNISRNPKSQNCSYGNTGSAYGSSCSLDTYVNDSYGGIGIEIPGAHINNREVYVSWWQYAQQANPGYGHVYTDWYPIERQPLGINPDWQVSSNCMFTTHLLGGCNPAGMSFFVQGNGTTQPNWAKYANHDSDELPGQWVQYEAHIKGNTPGSDDGDFEIWQNGTLLLQVNKNGSRIDGGSYQSGCYFGNGYTDSTPKTCGNFNGSTDISQGALLIGGDWGAVIPADSGSTNQNDYDDVNGRIVCKGGTLDGYTYSASQTCPPSGYIPYWHDYISDVIVMVPGS